MAPRKQNLLQQAVALHQAGRLEEAVRAYKKLLRADARAAGTLNLLGLAQFQRGHLPEAADALRRAALISPDLPNIDYNLGRILQAQGHLTDAVDHYQVAVAKAPQDAEAATNLGTVFAAVNRFDEAIAQYRHAIALNPRLADAWYNLGNAFKSTERYNDALDAFQQALLLRPNSAETLRSLAYAMFRLDRFDEALQFGFRAIAAAPQVADSHEVIAVLLAALGQADEAVAAYDRAIALDPASPDAPWNKALLLLSVGRFAEGWTYFHHRWKASAIARRRDYPQPQWTGQRIDGTLLVWAEQGLGDQVLMSSMIADARAYAGRIVLEVDQRLVPLMMRSIPDVTVIPQQSGLYEGPIEAQAALGDLGRYLRPDAGSFAASAAGYLKPDPARVAELRHRLHDGRRVIGLSWSSTNPEIGRSKSARLIDLAPVLQLPGCRFIDLQYGDTSKDREDVKAATGVQIDHLDDIDNTKDIEGLTSLMSACDAVVTVSNTNAHLAAAQGRPTYVLLSDGAGLLWYWMKRGPATPVYASARLFRRTSGQSWADLAAADVVPQIKQSLIRFRQ